jgi:hypothetical protein
LWRFDNEAVSQTFVLWRPYFIQGLLEMLVAPSLERASCRTVAWDIPDARDCRLSGFGPISRPQQMPLGLNSKVGRLYKCSTGLTPGDVTFHALAPGSLIFVSRNKIELDTVGSRQAPECRVQPIMDPGFMIVDRAIHACKKQLHHRVLARAECGFSTFATTNTALLQVASLVSPMLSGTVADRDFVASSRLPFLCRAKLKQKPKLVWCRVVLGLSTRK